jgi:hypothetical protein
MATPGRIRAEGAVELVRQDDEAAFGALLDYARVELGQKKWDCRAAVIRTLGRVGRANDRRARAVSLLAEGLTKTVAADNAPGLAACGVALGLIGDPAAGPPLAAAFLSARRHWSHEMNQASGHLGMAAAVLGARAVDRTELAADLNTRGAQQPYHDLWAYARWVLDGDVAGALQHATAAVDQRSRQFALAAVHDQPVEAKTLEALEPLVSQMPTLRLRQLVRVILARGVTRAAPAADAHVVWRVGGLPSGGEHAHGASELDEAAYLLAPWPEGDEDALAVAGQYHHTDAERALVRDHLVELLRGELAPTFILDQLAKFPWSHFDVSTLTTADGTLLHTAVRQNRGEAHSLEAALRVLEHFSEVNIRNPASNRDGEMPLHLVDALGSPKGLVLAKALLAKGANPMSKTTAGQTAVTLAINASAAYPNDVHRKALVELLRG